MVQRFAALRAKLKLKPWRKPIFIDSEEEETPQEEAESWRLPG